MNGEILLIQKEQEQIIQTMQSFGEGLVAWTISKFPHDEDRLLSAQGHARDALKIIQSNLEMNRSLKYVDIALLGDSVPGADDYMLLQFTKPEGVEIQHNDGVNLIKIVATMIDGLYLYIYPPTASRPHIVGSSYLPQSL